MSRQSIQSLRRRAPPHKSAVIAAAAKPSHSPQIIPRSGPDTRTLIPHYERRLRHLEMELTAQKVAGEKWRSAGADLERWRDYYLRLFETTPAPVVVLNASGFIVGTNRLSRQLLGLKPKRHVNVPFASFLIGGDTAAFLKHLRECAAKGKGTTIRVKIRSLRGSIQPVQLFTVPFASEPRGLALFQTLITTEGEQRQAEARLKRREQQYQAFVNSIEGIVWEANALNLQRTYVSRQAERLLGYAVEQWLYWPDFWQNHLAVEDRHRVLSLAARAVATREGYVCEYRMITANRKVIWLRDCVTVFEEDGKLKLRGISLDVTERKRVEEELQRARACLEEHVARRLAERED
jgi:PAS domain S-box-containing protein